MNGWRGSEGGREGGKEGGLAHLRGFHQCVEALDVLFNGVH